VFLDRLAQRHTVYAPQLPGTAPLGPARDHKVENFADLLLMYEQLVRALGIAGARSLAILGGMIAADLAAHFPLCSRRSCCSRPPAVARRASPKCSS